jgi:hypothetical protein
MLGIGAASGFSQQYEQSPIILVNGIAAQMSGGVVALNSPALLPTGFASFRPVSGASLLKNDCSQYPMANQAVAGNAMIAQPIPVSIEMICPANPSTVSYSNKSAIIEALVATLKQHNATGGSYNVYTPAFPYTNGVMLDFRDVTPGDTKQKQEVFSLDFLFLLITVAQAQAAQSALLQSITNGTPQAPANVPVM